MSYITTISGKHFDPIEPNPELIDETDIAHSLSLVCRGNGHLRHFYSVAQHSIACCREAMARLQPNRIALACLLHDASEAYLSDVTRPIKQCLPEYLRAEDVLQNMIWTHFMGTQPTEAERKIIFAIDDNMLSLEFRQLMAESISDDWQRLKSHPSLAYVDPQQVEAEFLKLIEELR